MKWVLAAIIALPSSVQATPFPVEAAGNPVEPTLAQCREALEQGRILRADADGSLLIFYGSTLFTIVIDETSLRCKASRHF